MTTYATAEVAEFRLTLHDGTRATQPYTVTYFDTDADEAIEHRQFSTLAAARAYFATFLAKLQAYN